MENSDDDTPRRGRGRPPGSHNVMTRAAREKAQREGLLPHEILLSIARGEPQVLQIPDGNGKTETRMVGVTLEDVKDAAKAAAPYYAPKLSTVETIQGVSDDDLYAIIAHAAAEAGISLGTGGGGEAQEDPHPADRTARRPRVPLA